MRRGRVTTRRVEGRGGRDQGTRVAPVRRSVRIGSEFGTGGGETFEETDKPQC